MIKFIIYSAGILIILCVIGLLLFLTFENVSSNQAIYGTRYGAYFISGSLSIFTNVGIIGIVVSFLLYLTTLISRNKFLGKASYILGIISSILIASSLVLSVTL